MDINSIILLQEEEQLLAAANQNNDTAQLAASPHKIGAASLEFLAAASTQAHTVASISYEKPQSKPNPASTPSHNIANVGGSNGGSTGPSPAGNFPAPSGDTNSPIIGDASVPPDATNTSATGYADKLAAFIDAMKNDPDDMAEGQLFMQYLQNLSADGLLSPGSKCSQILQGLGTNGLQTLLNQLVMQNAEASYFGLYNGTMGDTGAMSWITSQMATIQSIINNGHDNPVLDAMNGALMAAKQYFVATGNPPTSEFDKSHLTTDKNGNPVYYWAYNPTPNIPGSQPIVFYWTPNGPMSGDNSVIYKFIACGSLAQTPSPFMDNLNINQFDRSYRMQIFNEICKQYPNDPSIILTLFMLMVYNNEFNGDLSGETDQTNDQTNVTNQMSPITNLLSQIGSLDPKSAGDNGAQAMSLAQQINQITAMVNSMHSTEGYSANFTQNVYSTFWSTTVTYTASNGTVYTNAPLSQVYADALSGKITGQDFANALNTINPPPTGTSTGLPPTPSQSLQTITNAIQQANAEVSQQSKTIATLSASTSNTEDQVLKILNFATNTTSGGGGGFVALESQLIQNQVSH